MVQGKISDSEADTLTVQLGATPSGLISDPPPPSPHFMPDALPAATLPIYPVLGQAPNMLACIPNGLVFGRLFVKRFTLCYRTAVCPVCNIGILFGKI